MKNRFGIELEVISKIRRDIVSHIASETIGESKVDIQNFDYHSHKTDKWGFEADCSIHPNSDYRNDVEIITPPMKVNDLGDLKALLERLKGQISVNHSCGMHVHIEIPNRQTLVNATYIWRKWENLIIKILPKSRHTNEFCRKIETVSSDNIENLNITRHSMVNVQGYAYNGTIEFRGHSGTINYRKILKWVTLCDCIVTKAKEYDNSTDLLNDLADLEENDFYDFIQFNGKAKSYFIGRVKHFEKERGQQCAA